MGRYARSTFSQKTRSLSCERTFELAQDPAGFTYPKLYDLIGTFLRIAVGINAQLRRVARRSDMRYVAIVETDAHAVEHIDAHDFVEAKRSREEAR